MAVERIRPMKLFEVVRAYGPYSKGDRIQPTGMYRDVLMRQGVIVEVKVDSTEYEVPEELDNREISPRRMMRRGKKDRAA